MLYVCVVYGLGCSGDFFIYYQYLLFRLCV